MMQGLTYPRPSKAKTMVLFNMVSRIFFSESDCEQKVVERVTCKRENACASSCVDAVRNQESGTQSSSSKVSSYIPSRRLGKGLQVGTGASPLESVRQRCTIPPPDGFAPRLHFRWTLRHMIQAPSSSSSSSSWCYELWNSCCNPLEQHHSSSTKRKKKNPCFTLILLYRLESL